MPITYNLGRQNWFMHIYTYIDIYMTEIIGLIHFVNDFKFGLNSLV